MNNQDYTSQQVTTTNVDSQQVNWPSSLIDDIVLKIREHKIVPIIGPEMYYVKNGEEIISVQRYLTDCILNDTSYSFDKSLKESPLLHRAGYRGMTELNKLIRSDPNGDTRLALFNIYKKSNEIIKLNEKVWKFLEYGEFPLVITTCNFRYLSNRIKYKGRNYNEVSYKKGSQDITIINNNIDTPTIFYLFGTIGSDNKGAAITENDFLEWIHYLQDSKTLPHNLKEYLNDKYILSLGCEIPDWTFRLLLFSLKEVAGTLKGTGGGASFDGGIVTSGLDDNLATFLSEISYFSHTKLSDFLEDINNKITPENRPKVFLSMCHEDYKDNKGIGYEIRQKIGDQFDVRLYPDVDDPEYWLKIQEAIEWCDYFIPVITHRALNRLYQTELFSDIEKAKDTSNSKGLIIEWQMASKYKMQHRKTTKYCIPYCILENYSEFRDAVETKDRTKELLWPLFFGGRGVGAFMEPLSELTSEKLKNFINLNN